eukprot:Lithocolla_globosa_v1_NODE_974_length_3001_cov_245.781059.p1 type:complete len:359 gc:universal NODE_974_length_3001_cov_245.781059:1113-37(-)
MAQRAWIRLWHKWPDYNRQQHIFPVARYCIQCVGRDVCITYGNISNVIIKDTIASKACCLGEQVVQNLIVLVWPIIFHDVLTISILTLIIGMLFVRLGLLIVVRFIFRRDFLYLIKTPYISAAIVMVLDITIGWSLFQTLCIIASTLSIRKETFADVHADVLFWMMIVMMFVEMVFFAMACGSAFNGIWLIVFIDLQITRGSENDTRTAAILVILLIWSGLSILWSGMIIGKSQFEESPTYLLVNVFLGEEDYKPDSSQFIADIASQESPPISRHRSLSSSLHLSSFQQNLKPTKNTYNLTQKQQSSTQQQQTFHKDVFKNTASTRAETCRQTVYPWTQNQGRYNVKAIYQLKRDPRT